MRSFLKIPIIVITIILIALLSIYTIKIFSNYDTNNLTSSNEDKYVVQIDSSQLTQDEVLEIFGKEPVINADSQYYVLLLDNLGLEKLNSIQIPFRKVKFTVPKYQDKNINLVTIQEPVYIGKVQELANYGILINNYEDNKYTIWISDSKTADIKELSTVEDIRGLYTHERISNDVFSQLNNSQSIDVSVKVLLAQNNSFKELINEIEDLNGEITNNIPNEIMSSNIDSVNLKVNIPGVNILKLLERNPEIISIK